MARDFHRASCNRWSVIPVLVGSVLLQAGLAEGRPGGIASSDFTLDGGCHDCHSGSPGTVPLVSLVADDESLSVGQQITLTFVVTTQAPAQTHAGFNIRSSKQGTFAIGGPAPQMTRTIVGAMGWLEATHSAPKPNVIDGTATFTVLWTPAALTSGTVLFTAWGNSVNNADGNAGDRAAFTTRSVTVASSCVPVAETCNGLDDDCDGVADDGLPTSAFFPDTDGDSFGAAGGMKQACSQAQAGAGYVAIGTDCDDMRSAVHPGAVEICNAIDDNCNVTVDEGLPTTTFYRDGDADGYGAVAGPTMASCSATVAGYAAINTDCDDANGAVHPGVAEICNGQDDNCNAATDEGLPALTCGTGSCATTVPACVAGVPQTCTPVCPPEPDAAMDSASDPAPAPEQDSAVPVDVASDAAVDQSQSDDVRSDDVRPDDVRPDDVRPDDSDAAPGPAAIDALGPPIVIVADAARSPDSSSDVATRPSGADRATDASSAVKSPSSDGGCSCRVGSARTRGGAFPLVLVTLLLTACFRRRASGRRRPERSRR
jgi:hypothetical protein